MVEKPMASSANEALEMYRIASSSNKILTVGFQNRFDNQIIVAKNLVKNGLLGEFYYGETTSGGSVEVFHQIHRFTLKKWLGEESYLI